MEFSLYTEIYSLFESICYSVFNMEIKGEEQANN